MRTGSNPPDINRFRMNTRNLLFERIISLNVWHIRCFLIVFTVAATGLLVTVSTESIISPATDMISPPVHFGWTPEFSFKNVWLWKDWKLFGLTKFFRMKDVWCALQVCLFVTIVPKIWNQWRHPLLFLSSESLL